MGHLSKPLEEWTQEELIAELRFLGGIVELGEGRSLKEGEPISEAVLNYVRHLEHNRPSTEPSNTPGADFDEQL